MRSLVVTVDSVLMVATAVSASSSEVSQKQEQQIRQLEAELLKGEMNSDPVVFERILADDCLNLPAGPDFTKAKLVEGVRKAQGQPPAYTAQVANMHVYILGDIAVAIYEKEYAPRANRGQLDQQVATDVFVRNAGTWKLKVSRGTPLR